MTGYTRATFVGSNASFPAGGSKGIAFAAGGFDDPDSAECGAYLFQPDGDENAYYCDPERDLIFQAARQ